MSYSTSTFLASLICPLPVARHVSEDATPQQCQNRFSRTLDPTIRRGAWTNEEDAKLRQAVNVFGNSWAEVAEVIAGRTNEQCRDRWSDKISPTLSRGKWSDDEDKLLLEAVSRLGASNWKSISEHLGNGRTDNNVSLFHFILMSLKFLLSVEHAMTSCRRSRKHPTTLHRLSTLTNLQHITVRLDHLLRQLVPAPAPVPVPVQEKHQPSRLRKQTKASSGLPNTPSPYHNHKK